MHVQFLSDGNEFRSYGGGNLSKKKSSGGIFWWAILITLLVGAATFCWFFSILVFSHPEKPFNYKILAKCNKLPPLRPFTLYTAPNGKSLYARDWLGEFYPYSPQQLEVRNGLFKRAYLKNYQHEQPLYVMGTFKVLSVRELGAEDVFTQGWVVRARAADIEDVDVEIILPGAKSAQAPCQTGDELKLEKRTYASALNVQRINDDRLCVTAVPLAYQLQLATKPEPIRLSPPELLNMQAAWPVTGDPGIAMATPVVEGSDVAAKN